MKIIRTYSHIFNSAAWQDSHGCTRLLGRQVTDTSRVEGKPDATDLLLITTDKQDHTYERIVWHHKEDKLLEDPRVIIGPKQELIYGFAHVVRRPTDGAWVPYGALLTVPNADWHGELPDERLRILLELGPGKNLCPLTSDLWLFRRDGDEFNHVFSKVKISGEKIEVVGELDFRQRKPEWGQYRMGTTMQPIPVTDKWGVLLLHGITEDGAGHYRYCLGRAIVDLATFEITQIDQQAFLTSEQFMKAVPKTSFSELHPFRIVIYLCGGIIDGVEKTVRLFVNIGDTQTVEALFTFSQLTQGFF